MVLLILVQAVFQLFLIFTLNPIFILYQKEKKICFHSIGIYFMSSLFPFLLLTLYFFLSCLVSFLISSVTQSCLTLCDPMVCSTPGFPVHHQLPETTQTHVHWVGDAIQPSHPLLLLPPLVFSSIRVFSNQSVLRIRWPKYWSFSFSISPSNEYSALISFRMD